MRNESFLVGKKHTTLYKYVIIFGAACIFLRRPIFIFKDLTNVIFGIGSTKTSESTFRTLRVCCAAWLFLAPLFHKKRKWSRQTKMRARLPEYILILLFWGECPRIDANGAPRRSKQYNKRDFYPCHFKNESLQPRNCRAGLYKQTIGKLSCATQFFMMESLLAIKKEACVMPSVSHSL